MPVIISMLRGINVGGRNKIKTDALRSLYLSLKLKNPQTFIQSGNVIFYTQDQDLTLLSKRIQDAIHRKFGFRPDVLLRTLAELRDAIANTPFPASRNLDPSKILIVFLADKPCAQSSTALLKIKCEELHIRGRELYILFSQPYGSAQACLAAHRKNPKDFRYRPQLDVRHQAAPARRVPRDRGESTLLVCGTGTSKFPAA
jgi:uncharacterized protein (DUF1697 family)